MKFISTKAHGYLDYIFGFFIGLSPWVLGFSENIAAKNIALILGVGTVLYSMFTDYETGVFRAFTMKAHLLLDLLSALVLIVIPFTTEIGTTATYLFAIAGVMELLIVLFTKTKPSDVNDKENVGTTISSATQGGSNFGQGSMHLSGNAYKQGSVKSTGSNYKNEQGFSDE